MASNSGETESNILPWPRERAAEAMRAARANHVVGQLRTATSLALERPLMVLAAAVLAGFISGRLVGR
ncbi:MAG: hypothetical protein ACRDGF_00265 [Chloroflexota bacterium]